MKCKYCGKEFEQKCNNQVFCSIFCRTKYHIKYQKEFYHEQIKNGTILHCKYCGKEFESYKGRKFCSEECVRLDKNLKRKKYPEKKIKKYNLPKKEKVFHFGKIKVLAFKENDKFIWKAYDGNKEILKSVNCFDSLDLAIKDVRSAF